MVKIDTITKYLQTSKQPFEIGCLTVDIMCEKLEEDKHIPGKYFMGVSFNLYVLISIIFPIYTINIITSIQTKSLIK